jgi:hypothetical protein
MPVFLWKSTLSNTNLPYRCLERSTRIGDIGSQARMEQNLRPFAQVEPQLYSGM